MKNHGKKSSVYSFFLSAYIMAMFLASSGFTFNQGNFSMNVIKKLLMLLMHLYTFLLRMLQLFVQNIFRLRLLYSHYITLPYHKKTFVLNCINNCDILYIKDNDK